MKLERVNSGFVTFLKCDYWTCMGTHTLNLKQLFWPHELAAAEGAEG